MLRGHFHLTALLHFNPGSLNLTDSFVSEKVLKRYVLGCVLYREKCEGNYAFVTVPQLGLLVTPFLCACNGFSLSFPFFQFTPVTYVADPGCTKKIQLFC